MKKIIKNKRNLKEKMSKKRLNKMNKIAKMNMKNSMIKTRRNFCK
jgi:hypothetical protein